MAGYSYQQNDYDGASAGYVRYSVSPDLNRTVAPGEVITITGEAYHRQYAHACVELAVTVNGYVYYARVNQSIPAGRATAFSLSFPVTQAMAARISQGRTAPAELAFTLWRGENGSGTGDVMFASAVQRLILLKYRLNPVIAEAKFTRCRQGDAGWEKHNEGMFALAEVLRVSIASEASAADMTVHQLEYEDGEGGTHAVELLPAALLSGYAEAEPGLLRGVTFLLGRYYRLTVTVGDAYDTAQASVVLPRAYTNFHQSGAARGGAAFGMFSGSTDADALLESAYPIHAYEGVYGADGARLDGITEYAITAFGSQFAAYSDSEAPKAARTGRLVQLSGACQPTVAIPGGADEQLLFTLPRACWPLMPVCRVCNGAAAATWLLRVGTDGRATLSRYRNGASYAQAAAGAWLPLEAAWIASDYAGPVLLSCPARAMTASASQGCTASASTTYSSSYPAWRAFDFRETTSWASQASDPAPWLQLRLESALKNISVQVYARDTAYIENPTAGRVLGSNDGSSWTVLGSFSGWSATQSGGLLGEVRCEHETAYAYVRLEILERSHANTYVAVGYMAVRGEMGE